MARRGVLRHRIKSTGERVLIRNGALDLLKIIMALMVIGMHTGFLTDVSDLVSYVTLNGLFRIAVPVFLIINGYFFYRTSSTGDESGWFKRVALLYLIWMALYLPYWLPDYHNGLPSFVVKLVRTIFFGYYHLWYLAGMLGAAVVLSILVKLGSKITLLAATLAFILGVIIQYAGSYAVLGAGDLTATLTLRWVHRNFLLVSFPFFCAGYFLNKFQVVDRVKVGTAVGFVAIGLVSLMIESLLNFYDATGDRAFDNLLSLAILCPAIFILFMKTNVKVSSKEIAKYSTGIYLVHVLAIFWIQKFFSISSTVLTAAVAVVATILTYGLIKASRRLPFIR